MTEHNDFPEGRSLPAALAAVQAELPVIAKTETAKVPTKTGGSYSYSYADLAAISRAVLPLLGRHGLAWVTMPTLNGDHKFVLRYQLQHVSGASLTGEYPLSGNTPQEIGSAITYARRYCLCSVTGVAPESDDDDAAAASHKRVDEWEQAAQPPSETQRYVADRLAADIDSAVTQAEIEEIGTLVAGRLAHGEITQVQRDQLARRAAKRLAELRAVPDSEVTDG